MNEVQANDTLKDIRNMMERSSRFISLSGLSGISAGICALIGGYIAYQRLDYGNNTHLTFTPEVARVVMEVGLVTFFAALVSAFLFTYLRSKKTGVPLWSNVAKRVLFSVTIPMIIGGIVVLRLLQLELLVWIAPVCLLFYGLAVLSASKYTYSEIQYLGFGLLLLGCMNLWWLGYGLYFWAIGFGLLHIVYGIIMWSRYERAAK